MNHKIGYVNIEKEKVPRLHPRNKLVGIPLIGHQFLIIYMNIYLTFSIIGLYFNFEWWIFFFLLVGIYFLREHSHIVYINYYKRY